MSSILAPRRVVIGQNVHADLTALLLQARPELEIRGNVYTAITEDDLAWGEVYIGFKRPPLPTMGNIRWVHCTGAGVDSWFYPEELPRAILLTRSPEQFGPMIAEWALSRALAHAQQVVDLALKQREHTWAPRQTSLLRGTRAIVVGTGDVGTHVARLFGALGCEVTGVSRSGSGDRSVFHRVATVGELPALVPGAQWLVTMLPLTSSTRGLIGQAVLSACTGAFLINAGRGPVVVEALLPEALEKGWLSGAALDVFEVEPLPATSPLWGDARVMVSPHISGITTLAGAANGFLECLRSFEAGVSPKWLVDRDRQY